MSRAHRLRCCLALLPTLLPLAAGGCSAPNDDEPTPAGDMAATGERTEPHLNIVLIVADDLGWADLGSYGSRYYQTPNLDRLAMRGVKFTAAYANPNCAPTRAALMTGRYGPRTGVYTVNSGARGRPEFRHLTPPKNVTALPLGEVTIAEVLHDAGYVTAHMGKWHLGGRGHLPTDQGFDINIGGHEAGSPPGGYFSPYANPLLPDGPDGEYLTDRLADEAVAFILAANRQEPFFLHLSFHSVHTPVQPKPELMEPYRDRDPVGGQGRPDYAAMVAALDQAVGRVLQSIQDAGIGSRTAVIFLSDNGGVGGYAAAGVDSPLELTSNAPLRGGKGMLYEGGVRVPLIVSLPGALEAGGNPEAPVDQDSAATPGTGPGSVLDHPVMCVDLFPTILELAGIAVPDQIPIDGISILPLLLDRDSEVAFERGPIYWHFPGYLAARAETGAWRTTPAGAIRMGGYKLIEFFETGRIELYDLIEDIRERHDLAAAEPDVTRRLLEELKSWRSRLDAPMPTPLPATNP